MNKVVNLNRKEIWENYDPADIIKNKAITIKNYIPKEVKSILDVGCGNGIITNSLNEEYDVTGADLSDIALSYVKGKKIMCSCDSIPVANESFDMVFSSEMLEHLPDEVLSKAIEEFKRITKQYIFITVPNHEHLATSYVKCRKCGYVFHPFGHMHSFKLEDLNNFFKSDFNIIKSGVHGLKKRYYNPLLLSIKNNIADRWFDVQSNVICPNCNNNHFPKEKGNLISKACNLTNRLIGTKREYWLFALFKRK
ncbi:MAG: class I SAM-dependent methyltransferase [Prolixibacteraceae bacterium]|nr:class I SAM-dependent methyltransferase [Prolixibacteraceae bacterium]